MVNISVSSRSNTSKYIRNYEKYKRYSGSPKNIILIIHLQGHSQNHISLSYMGKNILQSVLMRLCKFKCIETGINHIFYKHCES